MDVAGVPNSLVKVARVSQKHPKGKLPEKRSMKVDMAQRREPHQDTR